MLRSLVFTLRISLFPLVGEYGYKFLVIIDGCYAEVTDVESLELVDSCDDVRELPY